MLNGSDQKTFSAVPPSRFFRPGKLFSKFLFALITGFAVSWSWSWFNEIKADKINLWLPYAYEYRYRGSQNERGQRSKAILPNEPITVGAESHFVFALENDNAHSLKNAVLHLNIPAGVKVVDPGPFKPFWPNEEYFFDYDGQILESGVICATEILTPAGQHIGAISFRFKEPRDYTFSYFVSAEDLHPMFKVFTIRSLTSTGNASEGEKLAHPQ